MIWLQCSMRGSNKFFMNILSEYMKNFIRNYISIEGEEILVEFAYFATDLVVDASS